MKKNIMFEVIVLVLGVVLMLTPTMIAPTCGPMPDGKFMKCHWMGQAVIGIGGVETGIGVMMLFVKKKSAKVGLAISNVLLGILAILITTVLIGGCMQPMMTCNTHTKPMVLLVSGIFIVVNAFFVWKNKEELSE